MAGLAGHPGTVGEQEAVVRLASTYRSVLLLSSALLVLLITILLLTWHGKAQSGITDEWKMYHSEALHLSLRYPPGWAVSEHNMRGPTSVDVDGPQENRPKGHFASITFMRRPGDGAAPESMLFGLFGGEEAHRMQTATNNEVCKIGRAESEGNKSLQLTCSVPNGELAMAEGKMAFLVGVYHSVVLTTKHDISPHHGFGIQRGQSKIQLSNSVG